MAQPPKGSKSPSKAPVDLEAGPGAAMRALVEEQQRQRRKRRRTQIATVALVLLILAYFAVTSFVFNPLEGSIIGFQNAVPRACDFFVRKVRLVDDLPLPSTVLTPFDENATLWKPIEEGRLGVPRAAIAEVRSTVANLQKSLEGAPIDLMNDLIGREFVLAGVFPQSGGIEKSRFGLYLRVSWKVRAGMGLARYATFRDKLFAGMSPELLNNGVLKITPPGYGGSLLLARVQDLLLIATDEGWIQESLDLIEARGQNSFGQGAEFNDQIGNKLTERTGTRSQAPSNLQLYLRIENLRRALGDTSEWPNPKSAAFEERLLRSVFNTQIPLDVSALVRFEKNPRRIAIDAFFDLDTKSLEVLGKRLVDSRPLQKRDVKLAFDMVPQSAFLGGVLNVGGGDLLKEIEASMSVEDRRMVDDGFRRTGKYDSFKTFCDELSIATGDRMIWIARENNYPVEDRDPKNDGGPDAAIAVAMRQLSQEKLGHLREYFLNNKQQFGITEVWNKDVRGFQRTEFYSPLVPGTGEMAMLPVGTEEVLVSNQAKLLDNVLATWRLTATEADKPYGEDPAFRALVDEATGENMNVLAWTYGPKLAKALQRYVDSWVQGDAFADPDKQRADREALFAQVLREKYPQFTPQGVPQKERDEVEAVVDQRMQQRERDAKARATPELRKRYQEVLSWVKAVPAVFAGAQLTAKHATVYMNLLLE